MTDSTRKPYRNTSSSGSKNEQPYQDLQQKIFDLFDTQNSPEDVDIEQARQAHRKAYKRQKHQEYKAKWVRETLRFTPTELQELTQIAKDFGLKRAPFLKACIYGYLQNTYILPDDHQVRTLELGINHIATSINETIRYIHQNKSLDISDIERIKSSIERLELVVSATMRTPPNLSQWIDEHIQADPKFLVHLQTILKQLDHDH